MFDLEFGQVCVVHIGIGALVGSGAVGADNLLERLSVTSLLHSVRLYILFYSLSPTE